MSGAKLTKNITLTKHYSFFFRFLSSIPFHFLVPDRYMLIDFYRSDTYFEK